MSQCKAKFRFDPESFRKMRSYVDDMKEHGADAKLDCKNRSLVVDRETVGKYDRVPIPQGDFMLHSHPGKCNSHNMCTVGLPSPVDLWNSIVSFQKGTKHQFVFSKEGTYVIELGPELRRRIENEGDAFLQKLKPQILHKFGALHTEFAVHRSVWNYTEYRKKWFVLTRAFGLRVKLVPPNQRPSITLPVPCGSGPTASRKPRRQRRTLSSRRGRRRRSRVSARSRTRKKKTRLKKRSHKRLR